MQPVSDQMPYAWPRRRPGRCSADVTPPSLRYKRDSTGRSLVCWPAACKTSSDRALPRWVVPPYIGAAPAAASRRVRSAGGSSVSRADAGGGEARKSASVVVAGLVHEKSRLVSGPRPGGNKDRSTVGGGYTEDEMYLTRQPLG